MRILAAGDLHADFRASRKLAEKAEKESVDMVVLCGDITQFDEGVEGMIGPFLKKGKKVIFVPGNHDSPATAEFLEKKYNITNIHGKYAIIDEVGFFGCGGGKPGPNFVGEREIFDYLEHGNRSLKNAKKKIMVTHLHPENTKMDQRTGFGSASVRRAVEEFNPDIHICGHMHESEGIEEYIGRTKIINPGKDGMIIEI